MSKRKTFRRVKVSNRGYVSGKRLQGFRAHEKKIAAVSVTSTGGGRVEQCCTPVSTSTIPENGGFVK